MAVLCKNLIAGGWVDAAGGETFETINPAHFDEVVATVPRSRETDVNMAVAAARKALPGWRLTPAPRRGEILFKAGEILGQQKQALGRLVTREMGKVLEEALGDVQEAIDMAYYMAGEGRRLSGETVPSELPDKDAKSVRVPVGVFALITPWNFPVAIPGWKTLAALICGNTVVFKPSSFTSLCGQRLVEALQSAGLPDGVLNLVHGKGEDVGERLANHPGVDGVSFTGSWTVGHEVAQACARGHKAFTTEMGGKNAIIVLDDGNLDLAVEGILWGAFGTSGQRCTATSRVVVQEGIHDRLVARINDSAAALKLGNGLHPEIQVGPLINEIQLERVLDYIRIGKEEGARLLVGGHRYTEGDCRRGYFVAPTVFVQVTPGMRIAREEIFGPVLSIIRVRDLDEAIQVVNDSDYGLSSAIYTGNVNATARAERDLDTGIVYVNASTIGAEIQLPFGGTKRTGFGPREAGGRGGALDLYSKWKVIYRDFSGRLQRAQIDKNPVASVTSGESG
jgi:acyl-CoA reductase-like NAD-dependent aldehyde dehydrogenase